MYRFPPDYIFFIARGILLNTPELNIARKEAYTEEELIKIFNCLSAAELYTKLAEIEEKTIKQLNLPEKDFYSLDDLAKHLNIEPEIPAS